MKYTLYTGQTDPLVAHYRAIGPASLIAALMAAPRKRCDKKPHFSHQSSYQTTD